MVSHTNPNLAVEIVPIDRLFLSPTNSRINDPGVEPLIGSLRRFGWQQPVVAKPTGEVIAGNTRLKAAKQLGMTTVPVVWFAGSDIDAVAYQIADNRLHEFSSWNNEELAKLLEHLRAEDSLDGVGYSSGDIDDLLSDLLDSAPAGELGDPGPEAPPPVAVARLGDLWQLGGHRLLCGDSTKLDDVLRVMGGEKAALVATDPPYLVDYTGERPNDSGKDWSATYKEIEIPDAGAFFRAVFGNVLSVLGPKAPIYTWHSHKRCGQIQQIWHELGILDHQQIVWVKPTPVFGRSMFHYRHEPCMVGWKKGEMPPHDGCHDHDSVWEVDWNGKARVVGNEHPTTKPTELFARPIRKHTRRGDAVFEPFSGSGSQIIAAEELGRCCRAIEISPPFVDVAIRRWEKATGKVATLDGRSFAETKVARAGEEAA